MRVSSEILVTSRIIQCWFGLADLEIQTASGDFEAGMTLEGVLEHEELRNCASTPAGVVSYRRRWRPN